MKDRDGFIMRVVSTDCMKETQFGFECPKCTTPYPSVAACLMCDCDE